MPPQPIKAGWPDHFYDKDGNIPCPAEGCTKVFETEGEFRVPNPHWSHLPDPSLPSHNDHAILQAVHSQLRCALCNFDTAGNLKGLFAHEKEVHGTTKMSSIQGYLSLMRSGEMNGVGDTWDEAFNRLVVKILASQHKSELLFKACHLLRVPAAQEQERLIDFLTDQNTSAGLDPKAVIPAEKFLYDIRPGLHDDSGWPKSYDALRSMYEQGTI